MNTTTTKNPTVTPIMTPVYEAITHRPIGLVSSRDLSWSGSKRGFFPRPIGSATWPQQV